MFDALVKWVAGCGRLFLQREIGGLLKKISWGLNLACFRQFRLSLGAARGLSESPAGAVGEPCWGCSRADGESCWGSAPLRRRFCWGSAPLLRRFCAASAPLLRRFCAASAPLLRRFCAASAPLRRRQFFLQSPFLCWAVQKISPVVRRFPDIRLQFQLLVLLLGLCGSSAGALRFFCWGSAVLLLGLCMHWVVLCG